VIQTTKEIKNFPYIHCCRYYDQSFLRKQLNIKHVNDFQGCIEILNTGKNSLECIQDESCESSSIVRGFLSYEKGVIASFKHCSESNLIYGNFIMNVKELLTELFKKASEIQILFFSILEKVKFDFSLNEDLNLLLKGKKNIILPFIGYYDYLYNYPVDSILLL